MAPAIHVEGVSKRYRLTRSGEGRLPYQTLRDDLVRLASLPVRWARGQLGRTEDFWALKDVSFEVQPGEVVGVIGRNGAGKSTLLKVLSRITKPTDGRVRLRGRVGSLLEVGTGFHPELTGRENIYLSGAVLGMSRAEIRRKFDEIVAFAEVEKFLDLAVKRYSSGMYMRLAFAVAAHLEPEILVVDEVLAVGDAAFQKKCLGKMGEVARGGRTVLFVSHNMNAVQQLCGSVIRLQGGRVTDHGTDVRRVTTDHLFGADEGLAAVWTNRDGLYPNRYFCPQRFAVVGTDGQPVRGPVAANETVWVEVECITEDTDPALCIGYAVYTEGGELLYLTYQTDRSEADWPTIRPGRNVLRSQFPRQLLNEGTYRLEMVGYMHHREWILEPGVTSPAVSVTVQGGLSDSPYWLARRPGLLAPTLLWERV